MIKLDDYSRGQRDALVTFLDYFEQQGEKVIEIDRFRDMVKLYIELLAKRCIKEDKGND